VRCLKAHDTTGQVTGQRYADAENAFALSSWNYLEDVSRQGTRFAWFADPTDLTQGLDNLFLQVYSSDNQSFQTAKAVPFPFRNLSVLIGRGCTVAVGADNSSFSFSKPADQLASLALVANSGNTWLTDTGNLTLPLCGRLVGTLQMPVSLHNDEQTTDFDNLDIGLQFFYQDQSVAADNGFFVASQRYPIFSNAQSNIPSRLVLKI